MYEEKKFSNINWKSLIIKFVILLLIVFLICFIIFRPKKNKNYVSLATNISSVKEVAINYFKDNLTIDEIGESDKVTLKILEAEGLIKSQVDSKGNSCDNTKSYIYLLKTHDDEYLLKVNMVCGKNEEAQTFTLTDKDLSVVAAKEEEEIIEKEEVIVEPIIEVNPEYVPEEPKTEIADNSTSKKPEKEDNNKVDNTKEACTEQTNQNGKVLRYKHIKYGEWTEGNRTGKAIENSTKEVNIYKLCKDGNCVTDRFENLYKYDGYTVTFSHKDNVPVYRYVYTVWSNSCCIKGFVNTGITEYQ